jgi:hypothetical protein
MIDYEMFCKIIGLHQQQGLKSAQIARSLGLDERTVAHWIEQGTYRVRKSANRPSKLDAFKPQIVRMLESYPYTGTQILQRFGFAISACAVGRGNEKGRVENAVGYVKKNFLAGLDIPEFGAIGPAAREWIDTVANVRIHGATHKKPAELFKTEAATLRTLPPMPYEVATTHQVRATNRFRVVLDTNKYSVPAQYAGARLTLKAYPERLCVYHNNELVARHTRSYDSHQDFEHPDHPRELLQQRRKAREQRLLMEFLKLSSRAEEYYQQLTQRRMNPRHHIRQIVALSEIYGLEKLARAIEDAFSFQAFSCEYIANILEQRERTCPQPGALHLTRRQDLLDLDLPEPNLSIYEPEEKPQPPEPDHEPPKDNPQDPRG